MKLADWWAAHLIQQQDDLLATIKAIRAGRETGEYPPKLSDITEIRGAEALEVE